MKPAAEASCSGRVEYTKVLTAEVVNTSPAAKKPTIYSRQLNFPLMARSFLTATWYISCEFDPITIVTPTIQHSMYAIVHHAKLGNVDLISETMDAIREINQASYSASSAQS